VTKAKAKIDWDTVELVGALLPTSATTPSSLSARPVLTKQSPRLSPRIFSDLRGRSIVKQILSGAAQKARTRGASHTQTQLRKLLPVGLEMLAYGWRLVAAAVESDRDVSRAVELATIAIIETSHRVVRR
jgi:hypothetical protein